MSNTDFVKKHKPRTCPVCGGLKRRALFKQAFGEISGGGLLQGYLVVSCSRCGFAFADHIPGQKEFDRHYRDMSKYEYQEQGGTETKYDLERFKGIVETVSNFLPDHAARILDIGCATGKLLSLFQEKGFLSVTGLDPSPVCAKVARGLYGVNVLTGAISGMDAALKGQKPYDCVILSGVLEHIQDSDQLLKSVWSVLSTNGIVVVEVPDATGFARWPDAPYQQFSTEHISFFSPVSLTNMLRRYGFSRVFYQQVPREQSFGTVMPVVTGIYRKGEKGAVPAPEIDRETDPALQDYLDKSKRIERGIHSVVDALVASALPVIVWGVGTHTLHLLSSSKLAKANIRAFVDSSPHYQGKRLLGRSILSPAALSGMAEPVLISSRVFQAVIEAQIREELKLPNQIIKLYSIE